MSCRFRQRSFADSKEATGKVFPLHQRVQNRRLLGVACNVRFTHCGAFGGNRTGLVLVSQAHPFDRPKQRRFGKWSRRTAPRATNLQVVARLGISRAPGSKSPVRFLSTLYPELSEIRIIILRLREQV